MFFFIFFINNLGVDACTCCAWPDCPSGDTCPRLTRDYTLHLTVVPLVWRPLAPDSYVKQIMHVKMIITSTPAKISVNWCHRLGQSRSNLIPRSKCSDSSHSSIKYNNDGVENSCWTHGIRTQNCNVPLCRLPVHRVPVCRLKNEEVWACRLDVLLRHTLCHFAW